MLIHCPNDEEAHAVFPTYSQLKSIVPEAEPRILLGMDKENNTLYFAVELPEDQNDIPEKFSSIGQFHDLRRVGATVDRNEAALLAYARGMVYWHRGHRFCGVCGAATRIEEAGHLRICSSKDCNRQHFPRTDPAVIMLITNRDKCLLGSARWWPKGMYSTLAGFVEPGESLELAVTREVFEETGVVVDPARVRYHSSQPWPFPASIMLGFTAETEHRDIRIDPNELEDARWFSREDIKKGLENQTFRLPSKYSIANRLIEEWRNYEKELKLISKK